MALSTTNLTAAGPGAADLSWAASFKGSGNNQVDMWTDSFNTYISGTPGSVTFANGNRVGFHVDIDNLKLYLAVKGTNWEDDNPSAGTGGQTLASSGPWYACFGGQNGGEVGTLYTKAADFSFTPASGYVGWDD